MKRSIFLILLLFYSAFYLMAQSKAELEKKRNETLGEINYVDNLLKTTSEKKSKSVNEVKIIGKKLIMREEVINVMNREMDLLSERLNLNQIAIEMMEDDLIKLKKNYSETIYNAYKEKKGNPDIVYILSAKDFNQGYKRLKYLQQVTKYRRDEAELIEMLKEQIGNTKVKLEVDRSKVSDLKSKEEQQKVLLQSEKRKQQSLIQSLNSKEKQLKKELDEKKKIANRIENEIKNLIEEERRKVVKVKATPEQNLIGNNFEENRGKLPWPVEQGIITSHFGVQKNSILKYLTEENIGIEFTCEGKEKVRSIFQGEVAKIFTISGANMTIILKHGKYYSVYSNIVNVRVKTGEKVSTKQELGDIYCDEKENSNGIIKFMIFDVEKKYLDPEQWIAKK
jgi:murein hydrolase activator